MSDRNKTQHLIHLTTGNLYARKITGNEKLMEFIRFCIVGGTCALIDAAIYYSVLFLLPERDFSVLTFTISPYQIALVCGYCISLCVNYYLSVRWTFKVSASKKNAVGIVAAHMFNLFIVRMGLMWLFVTLLRIPESIAYLPMAVISAVTNFLVVRFAVNKTSTRK